MQSMNLDLQSNFAFKQRIYHLYYEHLLAASLGWQRLFRQRYQTIGAVILIGLALTVCLTFGLGLRLIQKFKTELEQTSSITIFPNTEINEDQYQALVHRLNQHPELKELQIHSAGELVEELLDKNIAPSFWENIPGIITAASQPQLSMHAINQLKKKLEHDSDIIAVEFDQLWHAKITKLIDFVTVLSWIIGAVLVSSVILMINYSIKLLMEKYKQEIAILYDLGASSQFIQRPYLYQGFFLGSFGALFAIFSLAVPSFLLREQIIALITLYEIPLPLGQQDIILLIYILSGVISFSWICSYAATKKWLQIFELELN